MTENFQSQSLSPREEAAALERLASKNGGTTRQIGRAIKRSHMHVSRRMRVFEDALLAPLVQREQLKVSTPRSSYVCLMLTSARCSLGVP